MSRINDALKRARQAQRRSQPHGLTPLPPLTPKPASVIGWLLPALIGFALVTACFFIGLSSATRITIKAASRPKPLSAQEANRAVTPAAEPTLSAPSASPVPASAPLPLPPPPSSPPEPKLQGIIYATTRPWAIVSGQTVRVGDRFGEYRVKAISPRAVLLEGADGLQKRLVLDK